MATRTARDSNGHGDAAAARRALELEEEEEARDERGSAAPGLPFPFSLLGGVAQAMLAAALAHPDLQGLRRWLLATRDAHALYEKLGFEPLAEHDRYMILRPLKPPSTGG